MNIFKPGLLIWSMDRPAQLDLLLQSIEKFCPDQFDIKILFKASDKDYKRGYIKCSIYHDHRFYEEQDFNKDTKYLLSLNDYFAVSTDDTVITESFRLEKEHMKDVDIFSLRLGFNTIVQDPFSNRLQSALSRYQDEGNTIRWDSRLYHCTNNYGFQFGHDMVVYSKRYRELIEDAPFKKTNELETWLFNNCRDKINPFMRSFKHSVAVNIPSNNMSGITQSDNSLPIEEVNNKFLAGYRFRMNEIEKIKVVGCHQLENLIMENKL
jgi:hypothetical protein